MPKVTSSDGTKIWYDVVGEGDPLVLIGGSSLVSDQWEFMLPILKDHFKVILYDQRGAGRSDRPPAGITVEQWADDLKLVLDDIGIDRTHIFGTSKELYHLSKKQPRFRYWLEAFCIFLRDALPL